MRMRGAPSIPADNSSCLIESPPRGRARRASSWSSFSSGGRLVSHCGTPAATVEIDRLFVG